MSYKLNLTDGSLLVELIDGKIDNTSADLTFIGKNYQGFGEVLNENFIKLLENFNNTVPPTNPLQGQIWYDRVSGRLKVYNGSDFRNIDNVEYASSQPIQKIEGDIWIDSRTDQLYFYNGNEYVLVGPNHTKIEGLNGYITDTVKAKEDGLNKVINKLYVNSNLVAILSKDEFTPVPSILGFTKLFVGFNVSNLFPAFKFNGTASTALNIRDEDGNVFDTNSFLKTSPEGFEQTTKGALNIENNNGLIIGRAREYRQLIVGDRFTQQTTQNLKYELDLNGETGIYFTNTSPKGMGIFTDGPVNPINALDEFGNPVERNYVDINGDVIIRGDLRIQGEQLFVDAQTLRINDFQIILASSEENLEDSSAGLLPRTQLDEAGVIIDSSDNSIDWIYKYSTGSWTSSESIDLKNAGSSYKIAGQDILTANSLAASVTSAPGITTVGTLSQLQVDDINLNGNTITTTGGADLNFNVAGNVLFVVPKKISGVANPTDSQDAATKFYVDQQIQSLDIITTVDITGLGIDYEVEVDSGIDTVLINNVRAMLNNLAPASSYAAGTIARVMGVRYTYEAFSLDLVGAAGTVVSEIAAATTANPVVITTTGNHGLINGDEIIITDVVGMTELNNERLFVNVLNATSFELYTDSLLQNSLDGTNYNAYNNSGTLGKITPVQSVFTVATDPFDAGGTLNKNAVISAGFIAETEVGVTATVNRNLMYFTLGAGTWNHDPLNSKNDIFA